MKSVTDLCACARVLLLLIIALSWQLARANAEIIYDNSGGTGTNVYYSLLEYGDEVRLAGTGRVITEFQFEYYGDFVPTGNETARLRLYMNDGPGTYPSPKTVLYDSGNFQIFAGYQTKVFDGLSIVVTNSLTWTVQFSGLVGGTGDEAGLVFRNPPSVGKSFYDFWLKTSTGWRLFSWQGNPVANFAARISSGENAPSVTIHRDSSKVVVEWEGPSILQVADKIDGTFSDLPDVRNKYTFNTQTAPFRFWRLR